MRRFIPLVSGVGLLNLPGLAQRTISFRNIGPGFSQPVVDLNRSPIPAGAPYTIELLAGVTPNAMAPLWTPIISSHSGAGAVWNATV
jgi:hypothetical protein